MTYTPNIPQANDDPSASQPLILSNFQQINSQFGTDLTTGTGGDHILLTASSGNGKHNRVTFLDQSGAVAGVTAAGVNQNVFYGNTQSGITMPYYKRDALPTVWPVSPIKAYARVTATGVPEAQTLSNSFNITSVNLAVTTYTFTITNAMLNDTNYSVFVFPNRGSVIASLTVATVNSTTFTVNAILIGGDILNVLVVEP